MVVVAGGKEMPDGGNSLRKGLETGGNTVCLET